MRSTENVSLIFYSTQPMVAGERFIAVRLAPSVQKMPIVKIDAHIKSMVDFYAENGITASFFVPREGTIVLQLHSKNKFEVTSIARIARGLAARLRLAFNTFSMTSELKTSRNVLEACYA